MIKMIVFDMAGTTVDENNVVYKTLQKVINNEGFEFTLEEVLAICAGKEKMQAIKDITATVPQVVLSNSLQKIYNLFIDELANAYDNLILKPQPGATELFEALRNKNILVVLNTGYNRETAYAILQKLNWVEGVHIDAVLTASDVQQNRPQPDMIFLAMKKFDINNSKHVVKVGDSIIDIEEGKNAGCKYSIGITTGAHTHEQMLRAEPDFIIHKLAELLPIIS